MDNFFEILIYLIIIFSFLSSLFKKKEQEKKPGSTSPVPEREKEFSTSSVESGMEAKHSESYDVLKEIENIFKENMGIPIPQNQKKNKTISQQKENDKSEKTFEMNYDSQDEEMVSAESRAIKSSDGIDKLDEKTIRDAEKFEELLKINSRSGKKKHQIAYKLKNPQTLKEYIIVSEILGKPVAYRR